MVLGRASVLKPHRNVLLTTSTGALLRRSTFQSLAQYYKFEIHLLSWLQYPIERADHRRYLTGIQTSTATSEDLVSVLKLVHPFWLNFKVAA